MISRSSSLRLHHTASAEVAGPRRGCYRRTSVIVRREQSLILAGRMLMLGLGRHRRLVLFVRPGFLLRSRASLHSAMAAVECHMAVVVHDHRSVDVNVGDVHRIHTHHCGVVEERAATPFAAKKSYAAVTESVVNAAIESDVRSPIAGMPQIDAVAPTPVTRSPQQAHRSHYPRAWHPVVAIIVVPCPVTGSPEIARAGANRLFVNWQSRRTDADRNANADLRRGGG